MENLQRVELQLHRDHKELFELVKNFRNNRYVSSDLFRNLKWRLERHFYTEEKALLILCENNVELQPNLYQDLFAQHDEILEEVNKAAFELKTKDTYHWNRLKELLNAHLVFETGSLYKLLDTELNDDQTSKINEILNQSGNIGFFPIKQLRYFIREKVPDCNQE